LTGRSLLVLGGYDVEVEQRYDESVGLTVPALRLIVMGRTLEEAEAWARAAIAFGGSRAGQPSLGSTSASQRPVRGSSQCGTRSPTQSQDYDPATLTTQFLPRDLASTHMADGAVRGRRHLSGRHHAFSSVCSGEAATDRTALASLLDSGLPYVQLDCFHGCVC
jgi:hypothetical protein